MERAKLEIERPACRIGNLVGPTRARAPTKMGEHRCCIALDTDDKIIAVLSRHVRSLLSSAHMLCILVTRSPPSS